jgi:hypothetical protein
MRQDAGQHITTQSTDSRSSRQNRMRRRGRWAWPAPGGVTGLREVDGRYLRGSSQVDRGHEPCWQIAARMARYVMRTPVARGVLAPASLFAGSGLPADSGRTARTGPAVPVRGPSLTPPPKIPGEPCGADFQGGAVPGACPAGGCPHVLCQACPGLGGWLGWVQAASGRLGAGRAGW